MVGLPNALTVLRIALVPVFAVAFVLPGDLARITAFLVFAIASISDWLDGFAARKLKAGSDFGRMLDPIADKVLIAVALMMLVAEGTFTQIKPNGMLSLLKLDLPAAEAVKLRSIRHFNGLPIDARSVTNALVIEENL